MRLSCVDGDRTRPNRAKTPPYAPHELLEKIVGPLITRAESRGLSRVSESCEPTTPPSALASLRENSVSPVQPTVEPFMMYTAPPFAALFARNSVLCSLQEAFESDTKIAPPKVDTF